MLMLRKRNNGLHVHCVGVFEGELKVGMDLLMLWFGSGGGCWEYDRSANDFGGTIGHE